MIDALAEKDKRAIELGRLIESRRAAAALELHSILQDFTERVNALVTTSGLVLDPPDFEEAHFLDSDQNCFQINLRGRIVLIAFGAAGSGPSTENFRDPYILEGTIRCFNQQFLEHSSIEEHLLFYCVDCFVAGWRYFKPRTYQTGALDDSYLISILEILF